MKTAPGLLLLVTSSLALLAAGCGDDAQCHAGDPNPPACCAGGCGSSTEGWHAAECVDGRWQCERGTIELACASGFNACTVKTACAQTVGLGNKEKDPAPELCCELGCDGDKAVHRVCKDGLKFECPAGAVPISRCKNYMEACNGILQKYRDNGNKLPD